MQHRAARLAPPPPPAGWVWPREGEVIEVEVDEEGIPITWHKAKVIAVLIDGWFSAHITTPQDAIGWDDWFTWREEGTDWRRAMPPKAEAQKRKAEERPPPSSEPGSKKPKPARLSAKKRRAMAIQKANASEGFM